MSASYQCIKAEAQEGRTTCWAAALAWWLKAVPSRTKYEQYELISEYTDFWINEPDLSLSRKHIFDVVYDSRWQMNVQWITARSLTTAILKEHLARGPIFVGYHESKVNGNHVNIIYDAYGSDNHLRVRVMEPNGGKHRTRSINYYMGIGDLILASPKS